MPLVEQQSSEPRGGLLGGWSRATIFVAILADFHSAELPFLATSPMQDPIFDVEVANIDTPQQQQMWKTRATEKTLQNCLL